MINILKQKKSRLTKNGFTLVEVVVVLAILAILMALVVPNVISYINSSNDEEIKMTTNQIVTEMKIEKDYMASYQETSSGKDLLGVWGAPPYFDNDCSYTWDSEETDNEPPVSVNEIAGVFKVEKVRYCGDTGGYRVLWKDIDNNSYDYIVERDGTIRETTNSDKTDLLYNF